MARRMGTTVARPGGAVASQASAIDRRARGARVKRCSLGSITSRAQGRTPIAVPLCPDPPISRVYSPTRKSSLVGNRGSVHSERSPGDRARRTKMTSPRHPCLCSAAVISRPCAWGWAALPDWASERMRLHQPPCPRQLALLEPTPSTVETNSSPPASAAGDLRLACFGRGAASRVRGGNTR
jgi:hypothetical protein